MSERFPTKDRTDLSRRVGARESRRLKAQRRGTQNIWFGFGMFGLIGWSVAVPTLFGVALGLWLDKQHPGKHSWTLTLLIIGLVIGCLNAWHWVMREKNHIRKETETETETEDKDE